MQTYLPPEWSKQSAILLTWPHKNSEWYPSLLDVEKSFIEIAKGVTTYQKLIVSCLDQEHLAYVHSVLEKEGIHLDQVSLYVVPSNDVWARDHGPITVIANEKPKVLDFSFNGWGNKYPSSLDNQITQKLFKHGAFDSIDITSIPFVLEGGSIEVDGKGSLLTTESCLLSQERNPGLSKAQIETKLKDWLGVQQVLWLSHGQLEGDDTDGHIDTLARFTDPYTIAYVHCDDPSDTHYASLSKMKAELSTLKSLKNEPYNLVPLPWPKAKYAVDGRRLPATYANFLIMNQAVLMPVYNDEADELALSTIQTCFPDRDIIPVPCRNLIEQYGSLHCVTMQLPAPVEGKNER